MFSKHNIFIFLFILILGAVAKANVVGSDIQNFNPTTSGIDFVTVESSETLEPGLLNIGVFLNYSINSLPNYEDTTTQSRTDFQDSILAADLNFGLGLMKDWEIGASFPQVISADSEDNNDVVKGVIAKEGQTEIRVGTKYRLFGDADSGLALLAGMNFNLIENNPFAGDGAGPTLNAQVAYDRLIKKIAWGINLGYRFRQPGDQTEPTVEPFGNQFIFSTALSYLLRSWDSKVIAEIYGSFPAQNVKNTTDRDVSSMEFLLGLKTDIRSDLAMHVGGTTEVYHGSSSPDWRVYAGLNWVLGPLYSVDDKKKFYRVNPPTPQQIEDDPFSGPTSESEHYVAGDILFDFGSHKVNPELLAILRNLVAHLNKPPGFERLTIEGHTDSVGSDSYNLQLSQLRANSVRKVLIKKLGVPKNKVVAIGYGETQPIADNGNYQGRAKNRRVEFKIKR